MAQIVGAIGTSHSPMLLNDPQGWLERAGQDRHNPDLYDHEGRHVTFEELEAAAGGRYADQLDPDLWQQRHTACRTSMDRITRDFRDLAPDVVVVVGDDQSEVFDDSVQPLVGIYWGEEWHTGLLENAPPGQFFENVKQGYAMDDVYHFQGHPELALSMLSHSVEQGFDITSLARMPAGRGFGHAYGFVVRLMGDRPVPVVPVLLNTYYPPNQPSAARCFDLGKALAGGIDAAVGTDARVVFVASGGLSHFVVDERLDRQVLTAIAEDDAETLRSIPAHLLQSGSSEIRNWITIAGAMAGRGVAWSEYVPCYRTAAGTGCGMAFARWH